MRSERFLATGSGGRLDGFKYPSLLPGDGIDLRIVMDAWGSSDAWKCALRFSRLPLLLPGDKRPPCPHPHPHP